MKRIFSLVLLMLSVSISVQAETYSFEPEGSAFWYEAYDFMGELPEELPDVFSSILLPQDLILSGARKKTVWSNNPEQTRFDEVLFSVERDGKVLFIVGYWQDDIWTVAVESDCFLTTDSEHQIRIIPNYMDGELQYLEAAIVAGQETYWIRIEEGALAKLDRYQVMNDDMVGSLVSVSSGLFYFEIDGDEKRPLMINQSCIFPSRIAAWTADALPKSYVEVQKWYDEKSIHFLKEDQAFICDVNLRSQATSNSESLGYYDVARVTIMGSQPGKRYPWYHVEMGNIEGWVSGDYLVNFDDIAMYARCFGAAETVLPYAAACADVSLRNRPNESIIKDIPAGTIMRIITEKDGWLHVVLQEHDDWQVDWDSMYGYVKADEVVTGTSAADLMWKHSVYGN